MRDAPHRIFAAADFSSSDPRNAMWYSFSSSVMLYPATIRKYHKHRGYNWWKTEARGVKILQHNYLAFVIQFTLGGYMMYLEAGVTKRAFLSKLVSEAPFMNADQGDSWTDFESIGDASVST